MDYVEKKANTLDEAIALACEELGVKREDAEIEVLSDKKLFTKASVRVRAKKSVGKKAEEFLSGLLKLMGVDAEIVLEENDECASVTVKGEERGIIIGYRGDVLDAIQYLTLLVANGNSEDYKRVVVDAENYREKRAVTLTELAHKLEEKVSRTGRKVELEPMNPYERRIIHSALQGSDKATTESHGEEPNRHVVILPKHPMRQQERKRRPPRRDESEKEQYDESKVIRADANSYDPYAPCEESEAPKFNFAKTGFKKMRSFGYKRK